MVTRRLTGLVTTSSWDLSSDDLNMSLLNIHNFTVYNFEITCDLIFVIDEEELMNVNDLFWLQERIRGKRWILDSNPIVDG